LRRQPHAAAFARAWDAARGQAGSLIEDVAFERALEGIEHNIYDENGGVVATRRVYNDRLLMFLLRSLKPERYARHALATLALAAPEGATIEAEPCAQLSASLTALEPALPAPVTTLVDPATLEDELEIAEIADGKLPQFLCEQRAELPDELIRFNAAQAQIARGKAANEKHSTGAKLSEEEFRDMCTYYDPTDQPAPARKRKRYR
jgi:hypothetical protein